MFTGILFLLPALALALVLLTRRYPGERALARRLGASRHARAERPGASVPRAARPFAVAVHGGLLIARSLAVRPPPALFTAS
ncbi:MAG TPA: hypothetical protein VK701_02885 [Solirubrobacteraceae bacterium]|nr:hypothetical protein [Solirubrobacteraceae bacterium]